MHSSCTRKVSSLDSSARKAGFPTGKAVSRKHIFRRTMVQTNVDCQIANGREEDLNIGSGDQFRIHSSGIFEKSAAKQALGYDGDLETSRLRQQWPPTSQSVPQPQVDTIQAQRPLC